MSDEGKSSKESAQYKRRRRSRMKRLGFSEVTLYVPKKEVKPLREEMRRKVMKAEAMQALKYEGRDRRAEAQQNKGKPDVVVGGTPAAQAGTEIVSPHTAIQEAQDALQMAHETLGGRQVQPIGSTVKVGAPVAQGPSSTAPVVNVTMPGEQPMRPAGRPSDKDMDVMLAEANAKQFGSRW